MQWTDYPPLKSIKSRWNKPETIIWYCSALLAWAAIRSGVYIISFLYCISTSSRISRMSITVFAVFSKSRWPCLQISMRISPRTVPDNRLQFRFLCRSFCPCIIYNLPNVVNWLLNKYIPPFRLHLDTHFLGSWGLASTKTSLRFQIKPNDHVINFCIVCEVKYIQNYWKENILILRIHLSS